LTVCPSGCAFNQIAPALAATNNGDTIAIAAGTYDGGFTIDKSLKLVGAGAGSTFISGGGPVVTIGEVFAASEPTVSITGKGGRPRLCRREDGPLSRLCCLSPVAVWV
jgi:nitrous oxidase accessory protein NosD